MNARIAAVNALTGFFSKKSYSDSEIKNILFSAGLDRRDAALATRLYYGVLQNMAYIDFFLQQFSSVRLKKMHPRVLNILRVGAFQILFSDRIPDFAAVSESVDAAKATGNARATGLINAVLRKLTVQKDSLELPQELARDEYLSLRYSHPLELTRKLMSLYGEDTEALLAADNAAPPTVVRVNSLKATSEQAIASLREDGCEVEEYSIPKGALAITESGRVDALKAFSDGLIAVQDRASQLAVAALDPQAGDVIVDVCSAPGGKSLAAAAATGNKAEIYSFDIYPEKLEVVRKNAERLGARIHTQCRDALEPDESLFGKADRLIADLPCSGLGIIRKKPDIRYKELGSDLPALQLEILKRSWNYLKPGGIAVYSTCTILPEENGEVADRFIAEVGAEPIAFFTDLPEIYQAPKGQLTLLPHIHGTDGFFIAKLRKPK